MFSTKSGFISDSYSNLFLNNTTMCQVFSVYFKLNYIIGINHRKQKIIVKYYVKLGNALQEVSPVHLGL